LEATLPVGYSVYRPTGSAIHTGIDPRVKLAWLGTMFLLSLLFNDPIALGALLLALFVTAAAARLRLSDLRPYLLLSAWLTLLSVLIWPTYITTGQPLGKVWFVHVTSDGLLFGLAMGFRISIMIVTASTWMMITAPQLLSAGLTRLGLSAKAGIALASAIRFIPFMNAERTTIMEAQRARGADLAAGGPLKRTGRSVLTLVPLFSRAFVTAQNLSVAMDARGLGASPHRTSATVLRMRRIDRILVLAAVVAVAIGILCRVTGWGVLLGSYM
jgi:energy-coupling factor transport system permease protein